MKKYIALILAMLMALCLLSACGGHNDSDPGFEAVSTAVKNAADSDIMTDIPESYMESMMKLTADNYSECLVRISSVGTSIDEYGVFKTKDPSAMEDALNDYLAYRMEIWMDEYLPQELPKLQNAQVWAVGNYVMYVISDSETIDAAEIAFKGCFEG